MNLKEKLKTYNFWVSLGSAIFLILQIAGQKFGFYVDEGLFHDLFTSLCSILVILGIITAPSNKNLKKTNNPLDFTESATDLSSQETILDNAGNESIIKVDVVQETEDLPNEISINGQSDYIEKSHNALIETDSFSIDPITLANQSQETTQMVENNVDFQIENLVNVLNAEKEKFSDKTKYIEILENQISNLKNID